MEQRKELADTLDAWAKSAYTRDLYQGATPLAETLREADAMLSACKGGAVKVKPLEWEYHPAGTIAAPPTGHAYIIDTRMKGRCYSVKGFNPERQFDSLNEAKAAAQADYEGRILSALEPAPAALQEGEG